MRMKPDTTGLITAIDRYLTKADKKFENELKQQGFAEPKNTVKEIENLSNELADEFDGVVGAARKKLKNDGVAATLDTVEDLISDTSLATVFQNHLAQAVGRYAHSYLVQVDDGLTLNAVTQRTLDYIASTSAQLTERIKITNGEALERILSSSFTNGDSIQDVIGRLQEAYAFSYSRARKIAVTEVLTAHVAAADEAYRQNPAVEEKIWRHSGMHKNKPRPNHVKIDGQRVGKNDTFTLVGADGRTYHPKYPRDQMLPARERINCHCIIQPVVSKAVLGMDIDERKKRQAELVEQDDKAWEAELHRKNRARAGIEQNPFLPKYLKGNYTEKVKQLGGMHSGRTRLALINTGIITDKNADELYKVISSGKNSPVIRWKTLKELQEDGIIVIENSRFRHVIDGEYSKDTKKFLGGGHSQRGMKALKKNKIEFEVTKTFENGVRIGSVKRGKKVHIISWFPAKWNDKTILEAIDYVANNPTESIKKENKEGKFFGEDLLGKYKGVKIRVNRNADGKITSAFPHETQ